VGKLFFNEGHTVLSVHHEGPDSANYTFI